MRRRVQRKGKPRFICVRCEWRMKYDDPGRFHWSGVCDGCWTEADAAKESDLADKPRKKPAVEPRANVSPEVRARLARMQQDINRNGL
jgi:hypothetical protein